MLRITSNREHSDVWMHPREVIRVRRLQPLEGRTFPQDFYSLVPRISWGAGYPFLTNGREEEVVDTVPSVVPRVARLQQLPSTHGETLECRHKVELRTRQTTIPIEYHPGRTP